MPMGAIKAKHPMGGNWWWFVSGCLLLLAVHWCHGVWMNLDLSLLLPMGLAPWLSAQDILLLNSHLAAAGAGKQLHRALGIAASVQLIHS